MFLSVRSIKFCTSQMLSYVDYKIYIFKINKLNQAVSVDYLIMINCENLFEMSYHKMNYWEIEIFNIVGRINAVVYSVNI